MYFIDSTADLRETDRVRAGEPMPPLRDDLTEAHEWLSPPDGWDFARLACGPHFSRQPVTNSDGSSAWTWERVPAEPGTDEDRLNRRLDRLTERLTRRVPECLPLPTRHGLPDALTYASHLRLHVEGRLASRDSGVQPAAVPVEPLARVVQDGATAARRREPIAVDEPPPPIIPEDRQTPPVSRAFAARVRGEKTAKKLRGMMEGGLIRFITVPSRPEWVIFNAEQFIDGLLLRSRRAVDAAFACYEKSRDDARAILKASGEFTPTEVTTMLARLFEDAR
jgi:hypothetical protein